MLTLKSIDKAESFVAKQQAAGNNVRWEGWDLVFFTPDDQAYYSRNGAFRDGSWGFLNRSAVTTKGEWKIDRRDTID